MHYHVAPSIHTELRLIAPVSQSHLPGAATKIRSSPEFRVTINIVQLRYFEFYYACLATVNEMNPIYQTLEFYNN